VRTTFEFREGENAEECGRRVVELVKDKPLRKQMGTADKETVRHYYVIPRLLGDYLAVIEDIEPAV